MVIQAGSACGRWIRHVKESAADGKQGAADNASRLPDLRPGGWPNDTLPRRCLDVLASR